MALVGGDGKMSYAVPAWDMVKKEWVSFGENGRICSPSKNYRIKYPCLLEKKIDLATGAPKGKPDGTWKYASMNENKNTSLRKKILNELKNLKGLLSEQSVSLPEDTTNIGNRIPSEHKSFLRGLVEKAKNSGVAPDLRQDVVLRALDQSLRNGMTTDAFYQNMSTRFGVSLAGKPQNFSYSQAQSSAPKPPRRSGSAQSTTTYFKCKTPEEITATKEYQQKNGLTADGKIGKNTILKLVADKSFDLASKGLTVEKILKDPDRQIYHNSICSQLARTTASASVWGATPIKPGSAQDVTSAKEKWQATGRKCPVGVKEVGPYTVEEIEEVVKILMEQDIKSAYGENLMQTVASRVHYAIHKGDTPDCQDLVDAVFYSLQRGGKVAKKLSGVQATEQSSEVIDAIQRARTAAAAGDTYVDFALKLDQEAKEGSGDAEENKKLLAIARKYGIFDPKSPNYVAPGSSAEMVAKGSAPTIKSLEESKNWLDKTREGSSNSLFERLIKDISNKKTL